MREIGGGLGQVRIDQTRGEEEVRCIFSREADRGARVRDRDRARRGDLTCQASHPITWFSFPGSFQRSPMRSGDTFHASASGPVTSPATTVGIGPAIYSGAGHSEPKITVLTLNATISMI